MLTVLAVLQIIDGYDLLAIAFAASSVARDWQLTPSALGLVFAAGSAGSVVGAIFVGYLAGLFGRKTIIIMATLTVALSSLATAFMPALWGLTACRFVTGIGLGAMSPLVLAYNSEFFPERLRGRTSALLVAMLQFGQIIGGGIAAVVIPRFGWEAIFVIGSVAPIVMLPFLLRLPKSPSESTWEGKTEGPSERRPYTSVAAQSHASDNWIGHRFIPLRSITADGRTAIFIALLVAMSLGASAGYFMNSWMPVLVEKRGAPIGVALLGLSFYHAGGIVGSLAMGWLMDRVSPFRVIFVAFSIAVPLLALLGIVPPSAAILHSLAFLIGLVLPSGLLALLTASTIIFPNDVRVHVLASLTIIARAAAVLTPVAAGFLLTSGGSPFLLFVVVATLLAGAGVSLLVGANRSSTKR